MRPTACPASPVSWGSLGHALCTHWRQIVELAWPCCCCCLVTKSFLTLCDSMDYSPAGSSIHGIFQTSILEWVAISFSRGSFWPRDQTRISCTGRRVLYLWAWPCRDKKTPLLNLEEELMMEAWRLLQKEKEVLLLHFHFSFDYKTVA